MLSALPASSYHIYKLPVLQLALKFHTACCLLMAVEAILNCAASFCPLPVLSSCPDTSRVQTGWTRRRCQCWLDLWQRKGGNMRQPLFPIKPSRQQPKPLSSSSELALEWMRHHQPKPQTIAQVNSSRTAATCIQKHGWSSDSLLERRHKHKVLAL